MDLVEMLKYIAAILYCLLTTIPLVIRMNKYVKQTAKEKNWNLVLEEVVNLMKTAETKFENGAERKEWTLIMLKAGENDIDYNIDYDVVGEIIDSLCDMSKIVNSTTPTREKAGE